MQPHHAHARACWRVRHNSAGDILAVEQAMNSASVQQGLALLEVEKIAAAEGRTAAEKKAKAEERERAQRLARIAVSEMLLYQPDRFEQAVDAGNLEQILDLEIREARALLRQRIREDVREETDFIMDELNRVAADRSGKGGHAR